MTARSIKKMLLRTLATLAVLILILLIVSIFWLGGLLKTTAETVGPKVAGVSVKLETARVYPLRGKATLKGFALGNPKDYDAPHAVRLGELDVNLDVKSAFTDRILIRRVLIDGPEITIEGNPLGKNNLTDIQANLSGGAAPGKAAETPGKQPTPKPESEPAAGPRPPAKKVVIDELVIRNIQVRFGTAFALPIPDITMKDIGKDKDVTIADTVGLILDAIKEAAKNAAMAFYKIGGKGVKFVGDTAGSAVSGAGAVAGDALGATADGVKNLGAGLGGLIRGGDAPATESGK